MRRKSYDHYDGEPMHKAKRRRRRQDARRFEGRPTATEQDDSLAHEPDPVEGFALEVSSEDLLEQCRSDYARELVQRLAAFGLRPNTRVFDQHFLVDPDAIQTVTDSADIKSGDSVLEIGPGPGNLTESIWGQCEAVGARLTTIELDERFRPVLSHFPDELKRFWGDAIARFDEIVGGEGIDKVVANIPYKILEPLLVALHTNKRVRKAVLLVGKRYADRACASIRDSHSDFTTTSLFSQARFIPEVAAEVSRESFLPEPRTESAIVVLSERGRKERNPIFDTVARNIVRRPNIPTGQVVQNMIGGISGPKRMRGAGALHMASSIPRVSDLGLSKELLATPISSLPNHQLRDLLARLDLAKKRSRSRRR